jgi:hypothetical protein
MIWFKEMPLKLWADTLVRDFGQDDIPFLENEDNWRDWGNRVVGEPSFIRNNAPRTEGFETAEEWAQSVCGVMAGHP